MTKITPQMVKDLRDKTGAGMADCKKALVNAEGEMQSAIEELRKKGAASAEKRADRSANEGIVATKTTDDNKKAIIVELNCETDFVARNQDFVTYANQVADAVMNSEAATTEELLQVKVGDNTVEELHNDILAKFSEKIEIKKFQRVTSEGYIAEYIHAGSKLAVLIDVNIEAPNEQAVAHMRDIAMQIAAMNPTFLDKSQVDTETVEKEKQIYLEAAIAEGKKPEIAERIASGKLEKYYTENCLVEQTFVKDSTKNVAAVLKEIADDAKINDFIRYFLGEEA
jgi:elongation factor Ts